MTSGCHLQLEFLLDLKIDLEIDLKIELKIDLEIELEIDLEIELKLVLTRLDFENYNYYHVLIKLIKFVIVDMYWDIIMTLL